MAAPGATACTISVSSTSSPLANHGEADGARLDTTRTSGRGEMKQLVKLGQITADVAGRQGELRLGQLREHHRLTLTVRPVLEKRQDAVRRLELARAIAGCQGGTVGGAAAGRYDGRRRGPRHARPANSGNGRQRDAGERDAHHHRHLGTPGTVFTAVAHAYLTRGGSQSIGRG